MSAAAGAAASVAARVAALRAASAPPEDRGVARDLVRLQAIGPDGVTEGRVRDLPRLLRAGDLLVANRSALRLAAVTAELVSPSLPTWTPTGRTRLLVHLAHRYGPDVWLVEPRIDEATPGPLDLPIGARLRVAGVPAVLLGAYPGLPRLRFLRTLSDVEARGIGMGDIAAGDVDVGDVEVGDVAEPSNVATTDLGHAAALLGRPVRYGHLRTRPPASAYTTVFGDRPGSAEMASAGRPFTPALLADLHERGVEVQRVTLHAGVSGLDAPADDAALQVPPEAFEVDAATARAVNDALASDRRVIAVGTGAVRALESAWDGAKVRPVRGWTRAVLRPGRSGRFLAGVISGLHGPEASHLTLLRAVLGDDRVPEAYRAARDADLLAHEFGDLQLLWKSDRSPVRAARAVRSRSG